MNITIEVENLREVIGAFDLGKWKKAVNEPLTAIATEMENKSVEYLSDRIYGNAPSPRYRRTGAALRGRTMYSTGPSQVHIDYSSVIGGAARNYTPFLNRNSRIPKLNSKFLDDAFEETKKKASEIFLDNFTVPL